jgi:hypothetical protein
MPDEKWIIDDKGEVWPSTSSALRHMLFADLPAGRLAHYLIANLGFVSVEESEKGAHIRLRPAMVSPVAVTALLYWLFDHKPKRVVLSTFTHDWQHEIFASRQSFIDRLLSAIDAFSTTRPSNFLKKARAFGKLRPGSPLARTHREWLTRPTVDDEAAFIADCQRRFAGRFTITAPWNSGAVLILAIGAGYHSYNRNWVLLAHGRRHEDGPDYHYGRWVAAAHRQVLDASTPLLDDVDAIIERPGLGAHRVCYTRMILPFKRPGGGTWLLSASTLDDRIDLRVEHAQEPA